MQKPHNDFQLYKKIKEITKTWRKRIVISTVDEQGYIATTRREKLQIWKNYTETLFQHVRPDIIKTAYEEHDSSPILQAEVQTAINLAKNFKVSGLEGIPTAVLKLINENNLQHLTRLLNEIYDSGTFPAEWLKSYS